MGNFQHRKKSRDEGPEEEGFLYRALAAAIAIPLFEVSLFIGICAARISGRSAYFFFSIPAWLHSVYCSVAVAVGLIFGFRGLTWLLGHLFMTHFENDQDERITIALWLALFGLGALGYWVSK